MKQFVSPFPGISERDGHHEYSPRLCTAALIPRRPPPLTKDGGTDKTEDPVEPNLSILNINLVGVLYTTKLALHYFRRQHEKNKDVDQVLIMQGSLAGYIDLPGSMQYASSKYALRGMMRNLRRSGWTFGMRVNYIAPW